MLGRALVISQAGWFIFTPGKIGQLWKLCVGLVVDCTSSSGTDNPRLPTLFGESMIHLCQEFDYDMILCTFSDYLHVQILLNRLKYKS